LLVGLLHSGKQPRKRSTKQFYSFRTLVPKQNHIHIGIAQQTLNRTICICKPVHIYTYTRANLS
jgi:hypothetical protein